MSNAIATNSDSGTSGTTGSIGIGAPLPARQQRAHACAREADGTTGTRQPEPAPSPTAADETTEASAEAVEPAREATPEAIPEAVGAEDEATSPEVEPAPDPVLPEPAVAEVRLRHRLDAGARHLVREGKEMLTPPDLVRERASSPVERLAYGRYGEHTPPGGLGRTVQLAWTYAVSVPVALAAAAVSWWFERLARAVVLVLTLLAIWPTPVGQAIASVLAWAARVWADVITL